MERYQITINKVGFIPGVGKGPIKRPITVSKAIYDNLKKLGYDVRIVSSPVDTAKKITSKIAAETVVTPPVQSDDVQPPVATGETIVPPTVNPEGNTDGEEEIEDAVNPDTLADVATAPAGVGEEDADADVDGTAVDAEEEEVVEVLVDDKDLSAEAYYNEAFLASKNICKKILDNRKVQYDDAASHVILKKLVADSNPEVTIQE